MTLITVLVFLQMTLDNNPIEAGLGFFVKTKKEADFVGKDAVRHLKTHKDALTRKLVLLTLETDNVDPEGNETLWVGDKVRCNP